MQWVGGCCILLKRQVAELYNNCSTVRSSPRNCIYMQKLRKALILPVCAIFKCGPHAGRAHSICATTIPVKIMYSLSGGIPDLIYGYMDMDLDSVAFSTNKASGYIV